MLTANFLAIALLAAGVSVSAHAALSVSLSGAEHFDGVHNAVVSAKVTNTGDEVVKILNAPGSVLSKAPTDVFAISSSDGKVPRFQGLFAKYIPKADKSYTTLAPGESITVDHSLGNAYDFSASGAGTYHVNVASDFYVITAAGVETLSAKVVPHTARLSGDLVQRSVLPVPQATDRCNQVETEIIEAAAREANVLVRNSVDYLARHRPGTTTLHYQTWFGKTQTPLQFNTVQTVFLRLQQTTFEAYRYTCVPQEQCAGLIDDEAYTLPEDIGHIFVCPAFFQAPVGGTDSQPGIFVHLATHWITTGFTGHWAVGEENSKELAKTNPDLAVNNADSYEYFAENTPAEP